jgi:hypothetical protein
LWKPLNATLAMEIIMERSERRSQSINESVALYIRWEQSVTKHAMVSEVCQVCYHKVAKASLRECKGTRSLMWPPPCAEVWFSSRCNSMLQHGFVESVCTWGSLTLPCNCIHTATQMHAASLHGAILFAGRGRSICETVAGSYWDGLMLLSLPQVSVLRLKPSYRRVSRKYKDLRKCNNISSPFQAGGSLWYYLKINFFFFT